jgi:ABC-type branched-subunit amino acid transport system ATPase component
MIFKQFPAAEGAHRIGRLSLALSGGEQQMPAIGRPLMARPKMILTDEPSMGLCVGGAGRHGSVRSGSR